MSASDGSIPIDEISGWLSHEKRGRGVAREYYCSLTCDVMWLVTVTKLLKA
jgi:hypothetical protein